MSVKGNPAIALVEVPAAKPCAVCKLAGLYPTVPLVELLTAGVAAGIAIAMVGGMARDLCEPHQREVHDHINDALDAKGGPL